MKTRLRFAQTTSCLLLACLITLSTEAQQSSLTGHIIGLGTKPVVFGYSQGGVYKLDTVYAVNDRFTYLPKPSDDGQISLRISRPRYTSFWYEPGKITVTGAIDKPHKLTVRGGTDNNTMTQYRQTIEWVYEDRKKGNSSLEDSLVISQERNAIYEFIRQNPATKTSAYLLYWQAQTNDRPVDTYQQLATTLSPAVRESVYGKKAIKKIQLVINQPAVGKLAPDFMAPDTTGKKVSLSEFKGRYVLLDFWGHWCGPCIRAFPKLKDIQRKYADGLVIVGVAAEFKDHKSEWTSTIKKFNANWIQLSELQADKGDINERYNIMAFPTYFLLNKEGVVIEKSLSVQAIEEKLATLGELK